MSVLVSTVVQRRLARGYSLRWGAPPGAPSVVLVMELTIGFKCEGYVACSLGVAFSLALVAWSWRPRPPESLPPRNR